MEASTHAETVAIIIEAPHYDGDVARERRSRLVQILIRQPGAKRIIAYALGSGDRHELWNEDRPVTVQDAPAISQKLDHFTRSTSANRERSISRVVERNQRATLDHFNMSERRFRQGGHMPEEAYRLRILNAIQVDRLFHAFAPEEDCSNQELSEWRAGVLAPRTFRHPRNKAQEIIAFWVYDGEAAGGYGGPGSEARAIMLDPGVEAILNTSFKRDKISFGGVYYLHMPAAEPRKPNPIQPEARPCDHEPTVGRPRPLPPPSSGVVAASPEPKQAPPPSPPPVEPPAAPAPLAPPLPPPSAAPQPRVSPPADARLPSSPQPMPAPESPPPPPPVPLPLPRPVVSLPPIPDVIPIRVRAGEQYQDRLAKIFGPGAANLELQNARIVGDRGGARPPGNGTLTGGVFRYLSDGDRAGDHSFEVQFADQTGQTRKITLVVTVMRSGPDRPASPRRLDLMVSWAGAGDDVQIHVFTPEYRMTERNPAVPAVGNVSRAEPGAASFVARVDGAIASERVTFAQAARGTYVVVVRVVKASTTACQRGQISITYRVESPMRLTFRRDGLDARDSNSVMIPIACDSGWRLRQAHFATIVEASVP
jgi:hypothetical protein